MNQRPATNLEIIESGIMRTLDQLREKKRTLIESGSKEDIRKLTEISILYDQEVKLLLLVTGTMKSLANADKQEKIIVD